MCLIRSSGRLFKFVARYVSKNVIYGFNSKNFLQTLQIAEKADKIT
jgi:hypothetical protein